MSKISDKDWAQHTYKDGLCDKQKKRPNKV